MSGKVHLRCFGCRVNQAETDALRSRLAAAGWLPAAGLAEAGLCVVNTCTVTRDADREALKFLRRVRRENPRSRLVVTGCLAERAPESVREAAPQAEIVPRAGKDAWLAASGLGQEGGPAAPVPDRARAFLKIQDGCDGSCAYCVVPRVRPRLSSLPPDAVAARAGEFVAAGVPEIVLCGIRLGRYRHGGVDLPRLIERLLLLPGGFRLRLSSLEVQEADDALAALIAGSGGRVCPHLHLPLQSGSAATLRRMNRPCTPAVFARRVESLRRHIPGLALFTDIITGLPGETEAESRESLDFVRGLGLRGLHVFRYSRREGTPAASMPDQVPAAASRQRLGTWRDLDRSLRRAHAAEAVGHERVAAPLKIRPEAVTDDFLTVRLDRHPGPGLWRVRVTGPGRAEALGPWPCDSPLSPL